jgi:hypothetical protein
MLFPQAYVSRVRPFCVNDLGAQATLLDRRRVYRLLRVRAGRCSRTPPPVDTPHTPRRSAAQRTSSLRVRARAPASPAAIATPHDRLRAGLCEELRTRELCPIPSDPAPPR